MKCAISNIAWRQDEDEIIAEFLPRLGVQAVELAPTRLWADPIRATAAQVSEARRFWERRGLSIVALQALLFGHSELTIFESAEKRQETLDYLTGMISLGRDLGARVLVFGSPKNRKVGSLAASDAQAIAVNFFRELGNHAERAGVCFCIEPNPTYYDCDFVTTARAGLALVQAVNTTGFGLHLDAAAMTLAEEEPASALKKAEGHIQHFHASEKDLAPIGSKTVAHDTFAAELKRQRYPHWISIEMRAQPTESNRPALEKALDIVQTTYG